MFFFTNCRLKLQKSLFDPPFLYRRYIRCAAIVWPQFADKNACTVSNTTDIPSVVCLGYMPPFRKDKFQFLWRRTWSRHITACTWESFNTWMVLRGCYHCTWVYWSAKPAFGNPQLIPRLTRTTREASHNFRSWCSLCRAVPNGNVWYVSEATHTVRNAPEAREAHIVPAYNPLRQSKAGIFRWWNHSCALIVDRNDKPGKCLSVQAVCQSWKCVQRHLSAHPLRAFWARPTWASSVVVGILDSWARM